MAPRATIAVTLDEHAEPAWAVATLFPTQGNWSIEDYLLLPTNHLVEYSHGYVDVLPIPTQSHQLIVLFLYRALYAYVSDRHLGTLVIAPLRIRLWHGKYREPDLIFMLASHDDRRHEAFWDGADLVIEIVSPDDPGRDLVTKREEYAEAGIPEYWIVEPLAQTLTVLHLVEDMDRYTEYGRFGPGTIAQSATLPDFWIAVDAVLAGVS